MANAFTLYAQGFFVYPYAQSGTGAPRCSTFGAPFVQGHQLVVAVVRDQRQAAKPANWRVWRLRRRSELMLTGKNGNRQLDPLPAKVIFTRFGKGGEPTNGFDGLDMIPDAKFLMTPAKLTKDWLGGVRASLTCVGGELTAIPDLHTHFSVSTLSSGRKQVLSNLARYRVPELTKGSLTIDGLVVPITNDSICVIFNLVRRSANGDVEVYRRGLDHHAALARLCEIAPTLTLISPMEREARAPQKNDSIAEFIDVVQPARQAAGFESRDKNAEPGYSSCHGRVIRVTG